MRSKSIEDQSSSSRSQNKWLTLHVTILWFLDALGFFSWLFPMYAASYLCTHAVCSRCVCWLLVLERQVLSFAPSTRQSRTDHSLSQTRAVLIWFDCTFEEHPELVKKYLGSVVPTADNYFAALNRSDSHHTVDAGWCLLVHNMFHSHGQSLGIVWKSQRVAAANALTVSTSSLQVVRITLPVQCGLQRRLLLLHPQGYHLPHGDFDILSHQQQGAALRSIQFAFTKVWGLALAVQAV